MSLLSPRLQLKVAQKQILTPGLVQMVTVLQLNRLELKEMITQEIVKNPVLEEATDEAWRGDHARGTAAAAGSRDGQWNPPTSRSSKPACKATSTALDGELADVAINGSVFADAEETAANTAEPEVPTTVNDPLLEPAGRHRPLRRDRFRFVLRRLPRSRLQKPGLGIGRKALLRDFPFLARHPGRLSALAAGRGGDLRRGARRRRIHHRQPGRRRLPFRIAGGDRRRAASTGRRSWKTALRAVQSLDPAGVGARDLRECLLLQIDSVNGRGGVAWQIVSNHMRLLETRQYKEMAKLLGRPPRAHRDRREHDPAPQSASRPALFRAPARGWWSRTSISSRMATNTSSR